MGSFSLLHWLVVLVIVLLVFGTKRLANGAKDIGSAIKEFKKAYAKTTNRPISLAAPPRAPLPDPNRIMVSTETRAIYLVRYRF